MSLVTVHHLFRREIQRSRVNAVPQTGRLGTVLKDVAQVRVALTAKHLGAPHSVALIRFRLDIFRDSRLPKTRPPGSRVKFRFRTEQVVPTTDAPVDSLLMVIAVLPGKGPFGGLFSGNLKLFRRQLLFPLRIAPAYFVRHIEFLPFPCFHKPIGETEDQGSVLLIAKNWIVP